MNVLRMKMFEDEEDSQDEDEFEDDEDQDLLESAEVTA
jgi:hypothetical protein